MNGAREGKKSPTCDGSTACRQCPRKCGADRTEKPFGVCGTGWEFSVARAALHRWEEPPISGRGGSGTIFFAGCNLHCVFCQNREISGGAGGTVVTPEGLRRLMLRLRDEGAENINLVTPTHYTRQLAAFLPTVKAEIGIPVVWNSGGYESVESLRLLDGAVDVYLPDMKYYSSELSASYSSAPDYYPVAVAALREMLRQVGKPRFDGSGEKLLRGVIVRHLVLPGCRKDSIALLHALAKEFGTEAFLLSLMSQYTPEFALDAPYPNLHRRVTAFEYRSVLDVASELGFVGFSQERDSANSTFTPNFHEKTVF